MEFSDEPVKYAVRESKECLKRFPVIVLGSGASIQHDIPSMRDLSQHFKECELPSYFNERNIINWKKIVNKLETGDLESVLEKRNISDMFTKFIATETWKLINQKDRSLFRKIIREDYALPLSKLYNFLFESTNTKINVITTNYDRLAEYAADISGVNFFKGFSNGYIQRMSRQKRSTDRNTRTVNIWKVHGCLDWFRYYDDKYVSISRANMIPTDLTPAIVTPGIKKYGQIHEDPFRSIIFMADNAFNHADTYLCIGFGFNDRHIYPKLMEKWRFGAKLVILTKSLSENAKSMIRDQVDRDFLALEEDKDGTRLWSNQHPNSVVLRDINLWDLDCFLSHTT